MWVTCAIWLAMFAVTAPFLLVASPLEILMPWIYWFIPTTLVVVACVLMTTAQGRAERATW
jgi:hypothetical protein